MRFAILIVTFLPFLHFGIKDNALHFKARKVSAAEHLLHAGIGLTQIMLFVAALQGNFVLMLGALLLFVIAGGLDEYVFHRGIPAEESDLHAKQHLALLIFIVVALAVDHLEANQWNFRSFLPPPG